MSQPELGGGGHINVMAPSGAKLLPTIAGLLLLLTDACGRVQDDSRIDLTRCGPTSLDSLRSVVFELKASGRLLTGSGQCLTVQRNSYVVANSCTTTLSGQQRWSYDERSGRLMNPWSGFCAMHVTDPDRDGTSRWRQILMAQNCTAVQNSIAPFMRWTFTNP